MQIAVVQQDRSRKLSGCKRVCSGGSSTQQLKLTHLPPRWSVQYSTSRLQRTSHRPRSPLLKSELEPLPSGPQGPQGSARVHHPYSTTSLLEKWTLSSSQPIPYKLAASCHCLLPGPHPLMIQATKESSKPPPNKPVPAGDVISAPEVVYQAIMAEWLSRLTRINLLQSNSD